MALGPRAPPPVTGGPTHGDRGQRGRSQVRDGGPGLYLGAVWGGRFPGVYHQDLTAAVAALDNSMSPPPGLPSLPFS